MTATNDAPDRLTTAEDRWQQIEDRLAAIERRIHGHGSAAIATIDACLARIDACLARLDALRHDLAHGPWPRRASPRPQALRLSRRNRREPAPRARPQRPATGMHRPSRTHRWLYRPPPDPAPARTAADPFRAYERANIGGRVSDLALSRIRWCRSVIIVVDTSCEMSTSLWAWCFRDCRRWS